MVRNPIIACRLKLTGGGEEMPPRSFDGKLCIVTGAASGIGRALAFELSQRGAALALSDIDPVGLAETVRSLPSAPSNRLRADPLDVSDAAAIETYAALVSESLGDADYVFNVAGLTRVGAFKDTPLSSFDKIMDVNFWGVVRMTKAFLPQLLTTRGAVVNISSLFGLIGYPGQSHYCSSKFAVRGFSETLAMELEGEGVLVASVHPGGVATAIARNATFDGPDIPADARAELEKRFDRAAITSAEEAAEVILSGVARGERRIVVGRDAKFVSFVQRLLPQRYAGVLGRLLPNARS